MDLTDNEIRMRCKAAGIKIGPLTATTRKIYLRKLENHRPTEPEVANPFPEPKIKKPSKIPLPKSKSRSESPVTTNGKHAIATNTGVSEPEPSENQENEINLESMTNDELASFMRKLGLRFASIDSRNRPNYYKRIRQKLSEKNNIYQEFSTDDDEVIEAKPVQQNVQPLKAPNTRTVPKQKQIVIEDFSSSSSSEEETEVCAGVGTSILYPYSGDETVLETPERPQKRNVLSQIESNQIRKTQSNPTHNPKTAFPLATNSVSTGASIDKTSTVLLPPITRARTPHREHSPREKRKIDPSEIVTQAQTSRYDVQPISKRMRPQVAVPVRNTPGTDLVDLEIANYLPKLGLAGLLIIISLYLQKTWDKASSIITNLMPHLPELDELEDSETIFQPAESVDIEIAASDNIGIWMQKIFYQVNDLIIDKQCHLGIFFNKEEKPFMPFSALELDHKMRPVIIDEINKFPEYFIFKNDNGIITSELTETGSISVGDDKMQLSSSCRAIHFTAENIIIIGSIVSAVILTYIFSSFYSRYQSKREEFKKLTTKMAKDAIDVLQSHSARQGRVGIKREKVRDQVVQMGDDAKSWLEVERILKRDSRLQYNSLIEDGQEFEVWKWQETTINGELCQGQAFESTGKPAAAECLKIRNMFSPNDQSIDLERYKKVIFEWCRGLNGILHIDHDPDQGWLFVKCKDKSSAGHAFSRIHAQWYNRKLLAVSYIRNSRYEKRFPHSVGVHEVLC